MAMNYDILTTEIYDLMKTKPDLLTDPLIDESKFTKEKDPIKAQIEIAKVRTQIQRTIKCYTQGIINHLIANMEINNVNVGGNVETYLNGIGSHNGSLTAGSYPVTGAVQASNLLQSNNGTGHVK